MRFKKMRDLFSLESEIPKEVSHEAHVLYDMGCEMKEIEELIYARTNSKIKDY